jgi:hypothetical protein
MVEGIEGVTRVFVCPWTSGVVDFRKRSVTIMLSFCVDILVVCFFSLC